MRSYINFQFATLRKKVGPYIIAALALVLIGLLAILSANSANKDHRTSLDSIATFTKFFPFLFAVLFSALVITHIFKEGESDGSELIVVAKPLTRKQIVLGKFILSLAYVFAFQIVMFIGYIIFTQFDKYATSSEKLRWALSLFIGGIIVQVIASSIIIMLASALGKIGTIVISILFGAALPILSFILVPLGKGWRAGSINEGMYQKQSMVNVEAKDGKYISEDASSVYEEITNLDEFNSKYGDGGWYKGAAYLDIWYHWGRFYSALMPTDSSDTAIVKWSAIDEKPNTSILSTKNDGDYRIALRQSSRDQLTASERNAKIDSLVKPFDQKIISDNQAAYDAAPLLNKIEFIVQQNPALLNDTNYDYSSFVWKGMTGSNDQDLNYSAIAASVIMSQHNSQSDKLANASIDKIGSVVKYLNLTKTDTKQYYLQSKDFLPTGAVVAIWSVIGLAMCGAALYIYSRRDFK